MSTLSQAHLHDAAAAYKFAEAILWPNGPTCPRRKQTTARGALNGKSTRVGVYKCYQCRKPFTVKIGTVLEASRIPLHQWLLEKVIRSLVEKPKTRKAEKLSSR